jgi:hypothetical protein
MVAPSKLARWLIGSVALVAWAGNGCGEDESSDAVVATAGHAGSGAVGGAATQGGAGAGGTAATGGGGTAGGGAAAGGGGAASYAPLLAWDFESGAVDEPVVEVSSNPGGRFTFSTTVAQHGSQSGRIDRDMGAPPPTCGGSRGYGFVDALAAGIGQGDTIWIRAWFYFPSAMSWGFVYSTADDADMASCGLSGADGWGWTKFLGLGPDTGHLRPYLQIPGHRREVGRPTDGGGALYLINSETGGENQQVGDPAANAIPLDEWVAIQWMLYVHDTDGFSRAWLNDTFLGETATGGTIEDGAYAYVEWRLGDYWNGFPYTDGAADRGPFYVDEVILATDKAGYGAPDTTDDGGRPFIAPATRVADFSP